MGWYHDAFAEWVAAIDKKAQSMDSPHHRAILENYTKHVALEFSTGRMDEIFTPEMTVEEPVYNIRLATEEVVTYDGLSDVRNNFYKAIISKSVVTVDSEVLFVNDWGLASYSYFNDFKTGKEFADLGISGVDDPSADYVLRYPIAMFWPYDSNARLAGEDAFQVGVSELRKLDDADVVTFDDRDRILAPYLP